MPIETLRMAGRFACSAAFSLLAASTSAEPSSFANTVAGRHSSLPLTSASQLALHSALTSGGLTSPEHFGAFISTSHLPVHSPLHSPLAVAVQLALQLPLHSALQAASALPLHLPSQVPAHLPFESLPSHLPVHSPSHLPEISPEHSPLQVPLHEPSHLAPAST